MTDSDRYDKNSGKNDNAAKTIAIAALIVALLALFWAIKADNKAGDAMNKAESSSSTSAAEGA